MPSTMSRGRGRRTISEINMVPFIDVMLVLLIIFMVTAPLITPSMINLPSVANANSQPSKVTQIVIGKDESIELKVDDKTTRTTVKEAVAGALRSQQGVEAGKAAVVISADKSVKYETVVSVMNELQKAGVQRVGLSVQLAK